MQSSFVREIYGKPRSSYCAWCYISGEAAVEIGHSWEWKGSSSQLVNTARFSCPDGGHSNGVRPVFCNWVVHELVKAASYQEKQSPVSDDRPKFAYSICVRKNDRILIAASLLAHVFLISEIEPRLRVQMVQWLVQVFCFSLFILQFIQNLGLKSGCQFVDVFGLDSELLCMIPQPAYALLLLFPISGKVGNWSMSIQHQGVRGEVGSLVAPSNGGGGWGG